MFDRTRSVSEKRDVAFFIDLETNEMISVRVHDNCANEREIVLFDML